MSTGADVERNSEIKTVCENHERSVDTLEELVQELTVRLEPIVRTLPPAVNEATTVGSTPIQKAYQTSLASAINNRNRRVEMINSRLRTVLDLLEL